MKKITDYRALAFFDLDGTLLNAESKVDAEVAWAIAKIRENGVLPLIATGRGHFELGPIMEATGITGAIAMNGQYIVLDGEVLYKEAIPKTSIKKLAEAAQSQQEALAYYDDNGYWVDQMNDFVKRAYGHTHMPLPAVDSEKAWQGEVYMMLALTDQLSQVDFYREAVPELNFFMNTPTSIDITNISTNKGTGVKHLKEVLGFTGETYAFGDGRNDLHLLSACDHKTAMGNAVPELMELADFVTTANTDHGIVNAFEHWGIL
ncbi:Cof-type HAD-IIB family hydrolase [Lactococcus termiticola]|uniref:HAD family hydrolase n=1 Tax=Lactococcus termiticola TaxID=2169526 RepID=A0A2R5HGK2_9LACT|nr:Cof-type HAD-IIB family hydrolase [Lactococcus termiticola]GBG97144.1 HAD family hydrolase [Lactococcus termiticola]